MKNLIVRCVVPIAALWAAPARGGAGEESSAAGPVRYRVTNLAGLGGTSSAGNSINDLSWIAGASNLAGDQAQHATLWRSGATIDLGTLGGANSGVMWPVENLRGRISGIAETDALQPLGERWSCAAFFPTLTSHTCLGFVWKAGVMKALATFGGDNGFATGSNNFDQVVGWAEKDVADSTCVAPQVLQFRAAIWDARTGQPQELAPLPGDTVSAATAINDFGQVVGISGICDRAVGRYSAIHAVLWDHGSATDLGTLGGVAWVTPMAINQQGVVVGFSNVSAAAGGAFDAHAFVWTRHGGMQDLGTLPGDVYSEALGINEWGQVVGTSCSAGFASCRAFLWQRGVMTDLDTLVTSGYVDHLYTANDIDDLGEITGQAIEHDTGASVAFAATPVRVRRQADAASSRAVVATQGSPAVALPGSARRALLARSGIIDPADLAR